MLNKINANVLDVNSPNAINVSEVLTRSERAGNLSPGKLYQSVASLINDGDLAMQTVGAFEAKTHFSALLEKVEKGEHVIITKHGHPVAKLVPTGGSDHELSKKTIEHIKSFKKKHTLDKVSWKTLRDEGRR